jgi:hypothetical protein
MLRHGESQPRKEEGASHPARRGKDAEAFLKQIYTADREKRNTKWIMRKKPGLCSWKGITVHRLFCAPLTI